MRAVVQVKISEVLEVHSLNTRDVKHELLAQTARIAWTDLQRPFARGVVLWIDPDLDLIEVAVAFAEDRTDAVAEWRSSQQVKAVEDEQATCWLASGAVMWAVVIAPWVLVQAVNDQEP